MTIIIDADGCPVVDITVMTAKENKISCKIICDSCHIYEKDGAETITVDKGNDSADFKIANTVQKDDIVITQDYGLATMCLAKKAIVINQNGLIYDDRNIDALLYSRHEAKKLRNSGIRLKGPSKRNKEQDIAFHKTLSSLIHKN